MSKFTSHMQASSGIKSRQAYTHGRSDQPTTERGASMRGERERGEAMPDDCRPRRPARRVGLPRPLGGLTRGEKGVWEERHEEEYVRTCVCHRRLGVGSRTTPAPLARRGGWGSALLGGGGGGGARRREGSRRPKGCTGEIEID